MKIIDRLSEGVYFVDTHRTITYWNKAAETISGFTANEVMGRSCSDNILTHVDSQGESLCLGKCPLEKSILEKIPLEAEIFMHHKDGHRIPVSIKSHSMTDNKGNIIGGTLAGENESMDAILKRADTLLYRCKSSGRNCVVIG